MNYQQKLKTIRQMKNYNQKDMAEILKITQQQYSLIETGKRELHIDQLKEICEHFKISADYILDIKIKQ